MIRAMRWKTERDVRCFHWIAATRVSRSFASAVHSPSRHYRGKKRLVPKRRTDIKIKILKNPSAAAIVPGRGRTRPRRRSPECNFRVFFCQQFVRTALWGRRCRNRWPPSTPRAARTNTWKSAPAPCRDGGSTWRTPTLTYWRCPTIRAPRFSLSTTATVVNNYPLIT